MVLCKHTPCSATRVSGTTSPTSWATEERALKHRQVRSGLAMAVSARIAAAAPPVASDTWYRLGVAPEAGAPDRGRTWTYPVGRGASVGAIRRSDEEEAGGIGELKKKKRRHR